ncbi:diaminopimelate decarboxylase [Defluviicoccus vanus]|uniref:Diaminopimelate decarboxylase n=1 Tax=Defluviicoccus vanus TaxID=111831 RepID=A0A7H1N6M7_9PROT|nr:diaminopimelate decarboxylase [Defluviicoccus vanus]QNT71363.1 diaminopimelate decarboxylase [Defluviicoccus vanus]
MDHFDYRAGYLAAENVPIRRIAETVGTPVYVYSTATLERHFRVFAAAVADLGALVCYAVKANGNLAVVRALARLGAGADVVSGGELQTALVAGVPAERIVFSGVGKSEEELAAAISAGVMQINVESEPELRLLNQVALAMGCRAPAAIRVNPDVDAHTHEKISTGLSENKFGIDWTAAPRLYARAAAMPGIRLNGVAVHIGSQLTCVEPFREAFHRVRDLVAMLRADGHSIDTLDLGGGLGIPYGNEDGPLPSPVDYAAAIRHALADLRCQLILEPGRLLVGNAGVLVTRVLYVKEGTARTFVIVDAAMNDLMRPALYDAFHHIVPERQPACGVVPRVVDVVGPICETSDTFAAERPLPPVVAGDLLVIRTAGAYGASMASSYNARPLAAEVMVSGDAFAVVRERETVADLLARQHLPPWFEWPTPATPAATPVAKSATSGADAQP